MNWYKDILHLFTKLSEQSFQNILAYGTIARAVTNLVVSTIVLYGMTYALPLLMKAIAPVLGIKRMTGFAHFDMVSAVANASFLIFQILIGAFVIWRLLILLGGSGTYRGVMCNYIYGLAYTNALRTVVMVFVHILGLILFAISQQKYVADIAYLVTMFSQYYAVFICAQLMRRYVGLGIVKTYIVMFIVALLSVSVLPQWIRVFHTLVK
ncbi:MAG: hypothetical protein HXP19_00600 [Veillonella sp.]|jgi:hypothetical protein|uniref:hypothetical protein n=1 Tax=Veillonella TaxID=29465 RepID=UPI000CF4E0DF|nr:MULTISPECIES: hypothetical protein [Veillonella]MBF1753435.1 hypothetical protein [Veillonella sp.]MDU2711099.1 hypothetical protein [Veillonella sp.]MDU5003180.1 hypothetical protein [Veillonella sp.]PQL16532.1 hypothetical protein VEHSUH06_02835 [Veillonella sp. S13053-19]